MLSTQLAAFQAPKPKRITVTAKSGRKYDLTLDPDADINDPEVYSQIEDAVRQQEARQKPKSANEILGMVTGPASKPQVDRPAQARAQNADRVSGKTLFYAPQTPAEAANIPYAGIGAQKTPDQPILDPRGITKGLADAGAKAEGYVGDMLQQFVESQVPLVKAAPQGLKDAAKGGADAVLAMVDPLRLPEMGAQILTEPGNVAAGVGQTLDVRRFADPSVSVADKAAQAVNLAGLALGGFQAGKGILKGLKHSEAAGITKAAEPVPPVQEAPIATASKAPETTVQAPTTTETSPQVPNLSGIARSIEDPKRAAQGKEVAPSVARTNSAIDQAGKDIHAKVGDEGVKTIIRDKNFKEELLSVDEASAAITYRNSLEQQMDALDTQIQSAKDPADIEALKAKREELSRLDDEVSTAISRVRGAGFNEYGRVLQRAEDMTFTRQNVARMLKKANDYEEVPAKTAEYIKAQTDKIAAQQAEMDSLRAQLDTALKSQSGAPTGKLTKNPKSIIDRLAKTIGEQAGTPVDGVMPTKKAGAVSISNGDTFTRDINSLARHYIAGGAEGLDGVLEAFAKDLPSLKQDDILGALSGKYKTAKLEADIAKIRVTKQLRTVKAQAEFRQKTTVVKAALHAKSLITDLPRSLALGLDASFAALQAGKVALSSPSVWLKAWKPALEAFKAADTAKLQAIRETNPFYPKAVKAGLDFNQPYGIGGEFIAGKMMDVIDTALLKGYSRSDAAFAEFVNSVRMGLFEKLAKIAPGDAAYLKDLAAQINTFTGKAGTVTGKKIASSVPGKLLMAPSYTASKFEYALGTPIAASKTGLGRRVAAAEFYAKPAISGLLLIGLAKELAQMQGKKFEVDTDPRSTTFGRAEYDGQTIDVFGSEGQPARFVARLLAGSINQKGKYTKPSGTQMADVVFKEVAGKASPALRTTLQLLNGVYDEQIGGSRPMKSTDLFGNYLPLSARDVLDEGGKGAYLAPLNITGRGIRKGTLAKPEPKTPSLQEGFLSRYQPKKK